MLPLSARSYLRLIFWCSTLQFRPPPLRSLPCSPVSAVTLTFVPYRERWPERFVWFRRAAQPRPRIRRRTAFRVAAEVSAPATDSAQRLKSRSAGCRAAQLRGKRNRSTLEHPPRCTALPLLCLEIDALVEAA